MQTQQKKAKASLRESLETGVASSREANLKNGPIYFLFMSIVDKLGWGVT